MTVEAFLDRFALDCFRDTADGDYVMARAACRSCLAPQFLSASHQAIEKYLKCILLLNRVPAADVRHSLKAALGRISESANLDLNLSPRTTEFIGRLNCCSPFRYLEFPQYSFRAEIVSLDGAVWELRRYCTQSRVHRVAKVRRGVPPPKVVLPGGYLEKIIEGVRSPARELLLWQNVFFGKRHRKTVSLQRQGVFINPPLSHHPEMLDELRKYVHIPKAVAKVYGPAPSEHATQDA